MAVSRASRSIASRVSPFSVLAALCCVGLNGCVSLPPVSPTAQTTADDLASHVKFLAQPALKGRKPGTHGSHLARRYIEARFRACGLTPWPPATGYELSFGYLPFSGGKNIVGLLPGSDPKLADELVLVSAHYDHLGKDGRGRICPGAADNASGVAALLETARQLAQGPRPRRSILFVAFDAEEEMCLGSFAFCCRPEVQQAKLAGVVNLDILGRDFLEVVHHTLFLTGAEQYPDLRDQVRQAGTAAGIRVLPIGTDLVGPRSDHIAFESRNLPCLFFSSGIYKDYHLPTDTADKLNYTDIARTTKVVAQTVLALANCPQVPPGTDAAAGFAEELRTVTTVMTEVNERHSQAGVKNEDLEAFNKLAAEAERILASGKYDRRARTRLAAQAAGTLAPYLLPGDEAGGANPKDVAQFTEFLQQLYIAHRLELLEGYHRLVAHILKYRPSPFRGMPDFHYEVWEVTGDDVSLVELGKGRYALHVLVIPMNLEAQAKPSKWLLTSFGASLSAVPEFIDVEGTRQDLADRCLLALRAAQSNHLHYAKLARALPAVTGASPTRDYKQLLAQRLQSGGFRDESEWLSHCFLSDSPDLALAAVEAARQLKDPRLRTAACSLIANRNVRADVRAAAMDLAVQHKNRAVLLTLCDALDDTAPAYKKEFTPLLRDDYPFGERADAQSLRLIFETMFERSPDARKTIGDLAAAKLKGAADKDFGKDPLRWRNWIQRNVR